VARNPLHLQYIIHECAWMSSTFVPGDYFSINLSTCCLMVVYTDPAPTPFNHPPPPHFFYLKRLRTKNPEFLGQVFLKYRGGFITAVLSGFYRHPYPTYTRRVLTPPCPLTGRHAPLRVYLIYQSRPAIPPQYFPITSPRNYPTWPLDDSVLVLYNIHREVRYGCRTDKESFTSP
jgi:hypothetical protein